MLTDGADWQLIKSPSKSFQGEIIQFGHFYLFTWTRGARW